MTKVLLADDESIIRNGLREDIDWEALGATICGEAENGEEAWQLITRDPPDIVISDIRMPKKNGLELMQQARNLYPDLVFLFISGHDEFSYVQKALKLGAADYILKPIDLDYLTEKLQGLIRRMTDSSMKELALEESRRSRLRQFLQRIVLENRTDESRLIREAGLIGESSLTDSYFRVLSFQIDRYYSLAGAEGRSIDEIRRDFYHLPIHFDHHSAFLLTENLKEYDLILLGLSRRDLEESMEDALSSIFRELETKDFTVTIGIGEVTTRLSLLTKSFTQARNALELKFIKGENRIIRYGEYSAFRDGHRSTAWEPLSGELMNAIRNGDETAIQEGLRRMEAAISAENDPQAALKWMASDILMQIDRLMQERKLSIEEVMENPREELRKLNEKQTAEAVLLQLKTIVLPLASHIRTGKDRHTSIIQNRIVDWLKKHYAEPDLTLDKAAGEACMSASYFAVIFKQETGRTFNRYLTNLRMDKAKDLLLYSPMKSYEIGPQVGYENPSYFSTVFKKATGMSPSEYRKSFS